MKGDIGPTAVIIGTQKYSIINAMKLSQFDYSIEIPYEIIPGRMEVDLVKKQTRFSYRPHLYFKQPRTILSYFLYPCADDAYDYIRKNFRVNDHDYRLFILKGGPLFYFEQEIHALLDIIYKQPFESPGKPTTILNKRTPFNGEAPYYTFIKYASKPLDIDGSISNPTNDNADSPSQFVDVSTIHSCPGADSTTFISKYAGINLLTKLIKNFCKFNGVNDCGQSPQRGLLNINVPAWLVNYTDPTKTYNTITKNHFNPQHGDLWWGMIEVWPYSIAKNRTIVDLLFDYTDWTVYDSNGFYITDRFSDWFSNEYFNTSVIYSRDKMLIETQKNKYWPFNDANNSTRIPLNQRIATRVYLPT